METGRKWKQVFLFYSVAPFALFKEKSERWWEVGTRKKWQESRARCDVYTCPENLNREDEEKRAQYNFDATYCKRNHRRGVYRIFNGSFS